MSFTNQGLCTNIIANPPAGDALKISVYEAAIHYRESRPRRSFDRRFEGNRLDAGSTGGPIEVTAVAGRDSFKKDGIGGQNEFVEDGVLSARVNLTALALLAVALAQNSPARVQDHLAPQGPNAAREIVFSGLSWSLLTPDFSIQASPDLGSREPGRASGLRPDSPALFALQDATLPKPDPENAEKRRSRRVLMRLLTEGNLPTLGPRSAPVTMVIFSDFECPYCRKLMDILDQQILPAQANRIQVVYRTFPLASHPWALIAAEEAGCAALQGNGQFWALHNKIFGDQKTINKDNAKSRILVLAKSIPGINFEAFQTCVEKQAALKNVLRDVSMGNMASIYATPTLFVNGWRLDGVGSAGELKEVIAYALQDAQAHPASQDAGAKSGGTSK